ncbi:MAG: serine/threonine protein kinase [Deltaproteobacteria bacterium]|nr:serine/threonine protein kinase [Deltaproteobacteria bacterium]MCB9787498.1 serine/threonine protein kinase [Deltaproteobacteria bacterium]
MTSPPPPPPTSSDLVGTTVDGFAVEAEIARSLATRVYRATESAAGGRTVALKVMEPLEQRLLLDGQAINPLWREARFSQAVRDRAIVRVFRTGRLEDGRYYVAMEYVEGVSLDAMFRAGDAVDWREALSVAEQLVGAIARLHDARIIHCDIKPANVLVRRVSAKGELQAKLIDFGQARPSGAQQGLPISVGVDDAGTPQYMAPEQAAGAAPSFRTDVFSLGAVMYELLTGEPAMDLERPTAAACLAYLRSDAPIPTIAVSAYEPHLPKAIADIVERCLSRDPQRRPRDGMALLAELEVATREHERRSGARSVLRRSMAALRRLLTSPRRSKRSRSA